MCWEGVAIVSLRTSILSWTESAASHRRAGEARTAGSVELHCHIFYCLPVCRLVNTVSNWLVKWKGCRRKRQSPELRYCPGICVEGLRKNTRKVGQENLCRHRVSEWEAPVWKTEDNLLAVLTCIFNGYNL